MKPKSRARHDQNMISKVLLEAMQEPLPDDWRRLYLPEDRPELEAEVADLEAELDEVHPKWRDKVPWSNRRPEVQGFIKYRIKRLDLIWRGMSDRGINMVWKPPLRDGKPVPGARCWAVVVEPNTQRSEAFDQRFSVVSIARALRRDPSVIRQLLLRKPPEVRGLRKWLRSQLVALDERRGAARSAPLAKVTAPQPPGSEAEPPPASIDDLADPVSAGGGR